MTSTDPRARYQQSIDALNRGDWRQAQQLAMQLTREVPGHAGVFFVAGVAARELLQIPLAIDCLQRAVALNPNRADYLAQLARAWSQASEPGKAVEFAVRADAMGSDDVVTLDALGLVYTQAHAYEKAARMFGRVAELAPGHARHRFNHATALVHAGEVDAAGRELDACLQTDPRYWKAYMLRAQLRKQSRDDNHVDQLLQLIEVHGDEPSASLGLHMAVSKELEDLGRYEEALDHLVAGKRAARGARRYASSQDEALFEAIMQAAPGADVATGHRDAQPIFVFGLPRTGTTLVERILSSHSWVHSAGELQNFPVSFKRATGSTTRPMLDLDTVGRSTALDWRALGERYLASTRPATAGHPRFVDKLPHNFLYAGAIAAALPDAKLVCLRRDPMDSCISNFRQLFAPNSSYYDYSYDLLDTGRYYLMFDRLMKFWHARYPGRILEVRYEAVVGDLEGEARRLLDFCGLAWEDACLSFEHNRAPVATASALQVRSPIYRSAMGRWRRYGSKLDPLRELLEAGGVGIG